MKKPVFLKSLNREIPQRIEVSEFMNLASSTSERHARLERKDGVCVIKDLRSADGTRVNGAKIQEAYLEDGDLIKLGEDEYVFIATDDQANPFPMKSRNPVWHQELQSLGSVAATDFSILILGSSGTGKDVIARHLHRQSRRSDGPFVSVNCSALTESLIESELFGHVKGSFTGAISDRKGAFEEARGGTLFLDEIGDLSPNLQAKLLRALENYEIRPVGADRTVQTDVRVIAATHQSLPEKIRTGGFRGDLYFRLNVVSITPPDLNMRMEDFEDLLYTFAKELRVRFSFGAIVRLKKHSWPGNIRELKNLVARASALFPKQSIEEAHVEKLIDRTLLEPGEARMDTMPIIKEIEKHMIVQKMNFYKGNQRRAAQELGMPKSTLHDRLKYYNLRPADFKP